MNAKTQQPRQRMSNFVEIDGPIARVIVTGAGFDDEARTTTGKLEVNFAGNSISTVAPNIGRLNEVGIITPAIQQQALEAVLSAPTTSVTTYSDAKLAENLAAKNENFVA